MLNNKNNQHISKSQPSSLSILRKKAAILFVAKSGNEIVGRVNPIPMGARPFSNLLNKHPSKTKSVLSGQVSKIRFGIS